MSDTWNSKPKPGPRPIFNLMGKRPPPLPPRPVPPPKPDSLMPEIVKGSLTGLVNIAKGHPVYLATFKGGGKVVLKVESVGYIGRDNDIRSPFASQNAELASGLMGTVSKGVLNKPLKPSEVAVLKSWPNPSEELQYANATVEAKKGFWVKIPFTPGLHDFGKLQKKTDLDANEIASVGLLVSKLKTNSAAWKTLGQIFIVDLFIGNFDRINWQDMKVQNPGNLMFQADGDGDIQRAVGLDAFDPNAGQMSALYGTNIDEWQKIFGVVLKNEKAYARNAQRIVWHLNEFIEKRTQIKDAFGDAIPTAVAIGMDQGKAMLSQRIKAQVAGHKKTPSGVMARAVWLGWVK